MAAKRLTDEADDSAICCPICFEVYDDPRSLACLHTFCERCIKEFILLQQSTQADRLNKLIECPLCRKLTRVRYEGTPQGLWSKAIPVNFALQEVIDAISKNSEDKSEDVCTEHGRPFEFYSWEENELGCSFCAINKLKEGKAVTEIREIADAGIDRTRRVENDIQVLKVRTNNVRHYLDYRTSKMEVNNVNIEKELQDIQDEINEKLNQSRAVLLSEATYAKDQVEKQNRILQEQCSDLNNGLEQLLDDMYKALDSKDPQKIFIALHKLEKKTAVFKQQLGGYICLLKCSEISFTKDKLVQQILETGLKLGTVTVNDSVPDASDIEDYRRVQFLKKTSVDIFQTSLDEKQPLYSGMSFLPSGRLVLVDNSNRQCVLMGKSLEFISSYKFDRHIFDVVATSENEVYITGARRLDTVLVDSDGTLTPIHSLKLESCPFSISLFDDNAFVIGTYRSNKPAKLLSKMGTEKDISVDFRENQWKIDDSRCTYLPKSHLLVLTDRFENYVFIYNTTMRSEIRVKDERLVEPRGVAIGPRDCIFVCSKGRNSVVQLSLQGEILAEHQLDIKYPSTICFSKDHKLMALSNTVADEKKLQIYQLV